MESSKKYAGVFYREKVNKATGREERIFYIQYHAPDRKRHMEAIGSSLKGMTEAKANMIRTKRIEGKELSNEERREEERKKREEEASCWTIGRLWEDYAVDRQNKNKRGYDTDKSWYEKYLKSIFASKEPHEIHSFEVKKLRRQLEKKLKPQTVKHILALLRRIVNHGVKNQYCQPLSFQIKTPTVNNEKTENLTPDELSRLLSVLDNDFNHQAANLMKLALFTGMRRGELFKLKWQDIDFDRGFIWIRDPKGGEDQKIPLNETARDILAHHERPYTDSPYVFPGQGGKKRVEIKRAVNRIKKEAGLPEDFRPLHGLRHVYASMLASSGKVDMYTLQKLLTHKKPQMTQRYAHLRDETLKNASNLAGDIIKEAAEKQASKQVVNLNDYKQQ